MATPDAFRFALVAEQAARRAGREIILPASRQLRRQRLVEAGLESTTDADASQRVQMSTKAGFADLVTDADLSSERFIIDYFRKSFPDVELAFIGEEATSESAGSASKHTIQADRPTVIIDPIDGTTNFVHDLPGFVVSIGVVLGGEIAVGIVYDVVQDDCYSAIINNGAWLNHSERLRCCFVPNDPDPLSHSLVSGAMGASRREEHLQLAFANLRRVGERSHGLRIKGSAALNLALVARGSLDAYFEFGLHCWDMAAGMLLVREAGGVVLGMERRGELCSFDLMKRCVFAAHSAELARQIGDLVEPIEFESD